MRRTRRTFHRWALVGLGATIIAACSAGGLPPVRDAAASFDEVRLGEPLTLGRSLAGKYLVGRYASHERDGKAAADFLREALSLDPQNPDLLRRAFLAQVSEGEIDQSLPLARQVIDKTPDETVAGLVLGVAEIKAGRYRDAEKRVSALPRSGLNAFMGPLLRAWTLAALGKVDEGLTELATLSNGGGLGAMQDLHAALINEMAGRTEPALQYYRKTAAQPAGMSLRTVELLGALYERLGRFDEARAVYEEYRKQRPDSILVEPLIARLGGNARSKPPAITPADGMAEALFSLASALGQQSARESATLFNRLALYLKPDLAIAQLLMGDLLESDKRLLDANQIYAGIPKDSPFHWTGRLRAAANLNELKETDPAIAILEAMAAERTDQHEPLVQVADILRQRERFAESAEAMSRAIARIPAVERRHWGIFYGRGIAYERSKQWPKAEADFLKALELEPNQPLVLNYLGYSWVELGKNLDQARKMIEKAVELRPADGYIVDSLGWVLYRLGDMPGAVSKLERAIELRPDDPVINDHLGDAYWRVGRQIEARFQWRRALSFKPEPELVAEIDHKLKNGLTAPPPKLPGK